MISSSINALVIENETRRAEQLADLLAGSTHPFVNCRTASSLSDGTKLFESMTFDVVFTRLRLPDAKGLEALVRFHLLRKEAPVIVILDDEEQEVVLDAAQSLADDCLFWNDLDADRLMQSIGFALDRRDMLQELRERQANTDGAARKTPFKALLNCIDEALFLVKREDGSLLHANEVAKAWFGSSLEKALEDTFEYGVLEGDDIEMETPTPYAAVPNAELRSTCLEWKGIPACLITLRNISKRKRAEEAFLASQRRLELALKASNIGMWSWELRANRIRFSDRWKALLGYESSEFPDTLSRFRSSLHPDDRDRSIREFKRYMRDPWPDFECEYRMRHKDGSYRDILCRAELFSDRKGKLSKMMGSHIDITERKRQEEARALFEKQVQETQRFESLGALASGMAHCMNNLLTGMMGNIALLKSDIAESGESTDRIRKLDQCAHQAAELCGKLLSFSGKGNFVPQPMQLNETIFDCKEIIEISLSQGAKVDFQLAYELPDIVADRSEMQQLLLNLAMNSSEAMEDRQDPSLAIRTGSLELDDSAIGSFPDRMNAKPGNFVYLEIEDNGCGMSSEVIDRAFEPFFTTKFKGRGLGLSAVQGIVMALGGLLEVESLEGKGSRFRVYFPQAETSRSLPQSDLADRRKALIAEDEEVLRKAMTSMIKSFGYEPVLAEDGQMALELYEEHRGELAIALVDLNMPRMNGSRLFKAIRVHCQELPIILMSGDDDEVSLPFEDCEAERCRFLRKPFGMDELKRTMGSLIQAGEASLVSVS